MYKKYFIVFLLFLLWQIRSSAQFVASDTLVLQTKISIQRSQISLYEILNEIEEKYGINFSYANNLISLDALINVNFKDQTLEKVLDEIFNKSTITYKVIGKRVVLIKDSQTDPSVSLVQIKDTNSSTFDSDSRTGKNKYNKKSSTAITSFKWLMHKRKKIHLNEVISDFFKSSKPSFKSTRDSTLTWDSSLSTSFNEKIKNYVHLPPQYYQRKYSLILNYVTGPSIRKLYSDSDEGNYIISQREQETILPGYKYELILNYNFTPNFSIGHGFGLLKMGERGKFLYTDNDNRRKNVCKGDSTYYDSYEYYNNFSYLTLPFTAGYSIERRNFFLQIRTGISLCLLLSKGIELKYFNYEYYFDYGNSSSRRQRDMEVPLQIDYRAMNLACLFQGELGYRFGKISVSAGVSETRFLFSTYNNRTPLKEKRSLPGFTFGVQYHF
jgi:hypothetical protein